MRKTILPIIVFFLMAGFISAQVTTEVAEKRADVKTEGNSYVQLPIEAVGDTLYTIKIKGNGTNTNLALGVTIANDTIIVSSAGNSSTDVADNMFYRYLLDGTFIDSIAQTSTAGWGNRDLAFDGTYVVGSDNNDIRKFNPSDMSLVSTITNAGNNPHRGLAYDNGAYFSTNFTTGPLLKIDATTGVTLRDYGTPAVAPYGIAFDSYNVPGTGYLWYAEPSTAGNFKLSQVDTSTGNIVATVDLSAIFPESSGGLEIMNDHPDYPGRVIAVALVQADIDIIAFVDITLAGKPNPATDVVASIITIEDDVNLTWVDPNEDVVGNPLTPDSVQIFRGTDHIATVAGGVQAYADNNLPTGAHRYSVTVYANDQASVPASSNQLLIGFIFYDDFEDATLANWTIVDNSGATPTALWMRYTEPYPNAYTLPASSAGAVLAADSDEWGSATSGGNTSATMTTGADFSGQNLATLEFDSDFRIFSSSLDTGRVQISVDGGNWITVYEIIGADDRVVHHTIDLTPHGAAGAADVKVKFTYIAVGWNWFFVVDNVALIGGVIPVELTNFAASVVDGGVALNWSTATETNNSGFNVERSSDNVSFEAVGFVKGNGTTTSATQYSYVDNTVSTGSYYYRLKQVDYDGTFEYSNVVEANPGLPTEFALSQNYPNPFNPSTTIKFAAPVDSKVSITLYNTLGQQVMTLVNGQYSAGSHSIRLNASNLSSGVYFYTIQAEGATGSKFVATKKLMLMK